MDLYSMSAFCAEGNCNEREKNNRDFSNKEEEKNQSVNVRTLLSVINWCLREMAERTWWSIIFNFVYFYLFSLFVHESRANEFMENKKSISFWNFFRRLLFISNNWKDRAIVPRTHNSHFNRCNIPFFFCPPKSSAEFNWR